MSITRTEYERKLKAALDKALTTGDDRDYVKLAYSEAGKLPYDLLDKEQQPAFLSKKYGKRPKRRVAASRYQPYQPIRTTASTTYNAKEEEFARRVEKLYELTKIQLIELLIKCQDSLEALGEDVSEHYQAQTYF